MLIGQVREVDLHTRSQQNPHAPNAVVCACGTKWRLAAFPLVWAVDRVGRRLISFGSFLSSPWRLNQ